MRPGSAQLSRGSGEKGEGRAAASGSRPPLRRIGGGRFAFWLPTAVLLALAAALAMGAALSDSITVDEPTHLAAGVTPLLTGDFRLSPDHPPLARMWAALPVLALGARWTPAADPGWHAGDFSGLGRRWLAPPGQGDRLIQPARAMIVVLLLGLCLATALAAKRLFGHAAALLALFVAALDPSLLAHGHYVTADVAMALTALLSVAAAARLLARPTVRRLALTGLALGGAALTKFSWPLLLPALAAMAVAAVSWPAFRGGPPSPPAGPPRGGGDHVLAELAGGAGPGIRPGPLRRTATVAGLGLLLAAAVWLSVWAAYGFRFSPFRGADRATAMMAAPAGPAGQRPATMASAWQAVLRDPADGKPFALAPLVDLARRHRLLPEAYLYGLAYAYRTSRYRSAYLMGELSTTGWRRYFPIAFAIKTPLATSLLIAAGIAALAARRAAPTADPLLALGLLVFVATYGGAAVLSHLDIGQRHLLPLYPPLFMLAGAAAAWLPARSAQLLLAAGCLWLLAANLRACPEYLGYFNELAGGPRQGFRYLADSNVDWGQDLRRLAGYARRHPGERLVLAQFGSPPLPPGLAPALLDGGSPAAAAAPLAPGTYAVSATELLGVYDPLVRDTAWTERSLPQPPARPPATAPAAPLYRALTALVASCREHPAPARAASCQQAAGRFGMLRRARLLNRLRRRPPDARVGASLFLYRLGQSDLESLVRP
ncbi:MAG TPA: glycosyltransferase family 39 protein [Thermoanaerobaculia bacterium]|nr:glycosyltransferase family 39 protein [Thermoanaerobaculia bacterium]